MNARRCSRAPRIDAARRVCPHQHRRPTASHLPWHRRAPWRNRNRTHAVSPWASSSKRASQPSCSSLCPPEVLVPALAAGPVDVVICLGRELIAVAIIESPVTEGREMWAAQAAERELGRAGRGGRVKSAEAGPAGNNPGARPVGTITSRRRDRLRGQSRSAAVRRRGRINRDLMSSLQIRLARGQVAGPRVGRAGASAV